MTIKQLIKELEQFKSDEEVLVSSDEELNTLYGNFEVSRLIEEGSKNKVVIYGLSGSELPDVF